MKRKNDSGRNFNKIAIMVGIVIMAAILLCIGIIVLKPDCSELPQVLEYPNATIIRTHETRGSYPKIARFIYETSDSYEDVLAFYSSRIPCRDEETLMICETQPIRYMRYFVYLDKNSESPYQYEFQIDWNTRCLHVDTVYNDLFG